MKQYTAIHVGTRWATEHTWGVMVEGVGRPGAELLCVGCTQAQADSLVARLNGQPEERRPVKIAAAVVAAMVLLMVSGCTIAPLKGGHASTVSKSTQGIEQSVGADNSSVAAASAWPNASATCHRFRLATTSRPSTGVLS